MNLSTTTFRLGRVGAATLAVTGLLTAVGGIAAGADLSGSGEPVTIRWFVGVRADAPVERVAAQQGVVDQFNANRDDIELIIETVDSQTFVDSLSSQIAAGDAPDIVGPIGVTGSNAFAGQFLDLQPLVESTGFDLAVYEPSLVEFWRESNGALTGLPFAVFPSAMYYNKDLFDAAGLDYPPAAYGQPYADGEPWDMDKLAELARLLTVDANGNDATNPSFDPANVVQWGFHHQFNDDARAIGTFFGAGSFVADDGSAQIPQNWLASWQWYVDLIAEGVAPNQTLVNSDVLGQTNAFNTGHVAIAFSHLWYAYALRDQDGFAQDFWDLAAVPEYNGVATAKLHTDTFRILASTQNPDAAFEVLTYLLGDAAPVLLDTYIALGARPDQRDAYFARLDQSFPQGVNWQAALDGLQRPDIPSHLANMPNFNEAEARIDAFEDRLTTEAGLDVATAAEQLRADLGAVFARAPTPDAPFQTRRADRRRR